VKKYTNLGGRAFFQTGVASAVLGLALLATPAFAQVADEAADEGELIVVTGSRIARPDLESSTPVLVVTSDVIASQGAANISDILNELPAVGIGTSRTNSNFASSGNGQATVSLRNLGDNRTLVLQNGRRIVAGIGGSSAVDLNIIPTELIDRVDVLTGGASAVYGSEAIAGVVNFVLKNNYEGLGVRAQAGITGQGDLPTKLATITAGKNFADGRGNLTFYGQYDDDAGLRSRNRAISANDVPFRSSFTPQGSFFVTNADDPDVTDTYTYDPGNNLRLGFRNGIDGFNRNAERFISVPVERYAGAVLGHFDFSDAIGVFVEGSYVKTKSRSRIEASPLDNSDAVLPDGTILAGLALDNPFIPATILAGLNAAGDTVLPFRKRVTGVSDRSNRNEREFYRIVAGLKGKIADKWNWDLSYDYGRTTESTASETVFRDRFYFALDAIAGPNNTVICRDATARAAGCAPFNPFGFNSVSAASARYISNNGQLSTYDSKVSQQTFAGNVTGSLFALPAGDVAVAFGAERRIEKSSEVYDLQTQLGNTTGNALTNTLGKYKVFESYGEAVVPLVKEKAGIHFLGLEGAVRFGDYSTVGTVFSWKAGANYAPVESLRFRGVYSVATRAPNIGELFKGPAQDFPTIVDPCEGATATSSRPQDAYCRTIPGIAARIAQVGVFQYDDNTDVQSVEGSDGGNPNLSEEKAKTLTLGAVFTPNFIRNFSMTVDFFDIRVKNAIQLIPRDTVISQCVNTAGASPLCNLIVREVVGNPRSRTPGTVFQVDSLPVNAASIKTRGIDVAMRYKTPDFKLLGQEESSLSFALAYTYVDKLTLQPLAGLPVENNRGQLDGDGRLGAGFKHKGNLSTTIDVGPISLNWRMNYLGSIKDTLGPDATSPLGDSTNSIKARVYHDAQLRFNVAGDSSKRTLEFYAGVDNLFDKKPPSINQNGASNITGTETAADTYDPYGRRFYFGAAFKF
jgi:iron complex outermembrane recepter protein